MSREAQRQPSGAAISREDQRQPSGAAISREDQRQPSGAAISREDQRQPSGAAISREATGSSVRRALALALAADLLVAPLLTARLGAPGDPDPFVAAAQGPLGLALAAVGIGCALQLARGRGAAWLLGALAALAVLEEGVGRASGVYFEPAFVSGTAAVGYLLGVGFARATGASASRYATLGVAAGLAAVYVAAGLSKLLASGAAWGLDPVVVRAMVAAHHDVEASAPRAAIGDLVIASPLAGVAMAGGALLVELGAASLVVGPRARRFASGGLLVFHAVLYWLTGILFVEGALLLFVVGGWGEPVARRLRGRPVTAIYGAIAVVAALAWGATQARVAGLPGPAMVGLIGAWLAGESLAPVAPPTSPPRPVDRRRAALALGAWLTVATLAWALPTEPRGHPLDARAEDATSRERRSSAR